MSTEDFLTLVVATVAAIAATAAAVFTGIQAAAARGAVRESKAAQAASESARDESVRLAAEANEVASRQAAALERQVELEEEKLVPSVEWQIRPGPRGDIQLLTNAGNVPAYDVDLGGTEGVHVDEDSKSPVLHPGESVEFMVWRGGGMAAPRLTILWREQPSGERKSRETTVRPLR